MSNLIPMSEIDKMGTAVAKSGLFGIKKAEEFIALALIAQAEGRHPAIVARDYHIINGKPTLKADAILARFQEAGGSIKWKKLDDTIAQAEFAHPSSGAITLDWTIERAKTAGVTGNPTWSKYPRAMLRARLISEGVRTMFPAVLCGVYTPEEVQDMEYKLEAPIETPCEVVPETLTQEQVDTIEKLCEFIGVKPESILVEIKRKSFAEVSQEKYEGLVKFIEGKKVV